MLSTWYFQLCTFLKNTAAIYTYYTKTYMSSFLSHDMLCNPADLILQKSSACESMTVQIAFSRSPRRVFFFGIFLGRKINAGRPADNLKVSF